MADIAVPTHLGLILDGNRRWAKAHGKPTLVGHRKGYDNLKDIAKFAINQGVKFVSAYIFSTENWDRSEKEVNYLMRLAYRMITKDVEELNKENIKIVWLGSSDKLSDKLIKAIRDAEESTKNNTKGTLCLCFNYGGYQEITDAVEKVKASNQKVDIETIRKNIYHPEIPVVDLVIRTSGEQRLSGFMLWRIAYAELIFSNKFWPDYSTDDLISDFEEYTKRERRFGQ